jgi:hypothetical protein
MSRARADSFGLVADNGFLILNFNICLNILKNSYKFPNSIEIGRTLRKYKLNFSGILVKKYI